MRLMMIFLTVLFTFSKPILACHGGEAEPGSTPHPGDMSQPVCSQLNPNLCYMIWFQSFINTSEEGKFIIRIQGPQVSLNQIKVDLWMEMSTGHGHGSTPLIYTELMPNVFQVSNAHFVMPGEWKIRLHITDGTHVESLVTSIFVEK